MDNMMAAKQMLENLNFSSNLEAERRMKLVGYRVQSAVWNPGYMVCHVVSFGIRTLIHPEDQVVDRYIVMCQALATGKKNLQRLQCTAVHP